MKKHTILLILVIVVACLMGLAACGNNNDSGIQFKTLQVTDTTVYGEVSNDTSQFSFIDEISTSDSVTYDVCKDLACTEIIPSKTVELNVGNNVFYLLVKKNHDVKLFTVTIRRRPLYLVTTEIDDSNVTRQYIEENDKINEPQQPNVNGYTFSNWEINGTIATFPYTVIGNTTVKAKLVANQYTVAFDVNGGEPLTSSELVVTYNEYYSLEIPTREGYTFDGWYDNDTLLNNYDKWIYLQNKSLKAKWNINSYNITLSKNFTNAGDIVSISDQAEFNSQITISAIDNEFLGYTWLGWYDGETLLTTSSYFTFNMPAHNINYVATWKLDERLVQYDFASDKTTCIINNAKSKEMTEASLPEYVTEIANYAFKDCVDLIDVLIPSNVRTIGIGAFQGCINLKNISLNDKIDTIKDYSFKDCTSLISITIPSGVISIGSSVFSGCTKLRNIEFNNSITKIDDYAFQDCTSITNIIIPNNITTIGIGVFSGCTELSKITLPFLGANATSNLCFGYVFGADNYNENVTCVPQSLREVTIVAGQEIARECFYGCTSIQNILLPNQLSKIGRSAFANCSLLQSMVIPDSVSEIDMYALSGCSNLNTLTLPYCNFIGSGFSSIFGVGAVAPDSLKTINISRGSYISDYAFRNYTNVQTINLPNTITSIGSFAFQNCKQLKEIYIPSRVNSIGRNPFAGCERLEKIEVNINNTTYNSQGNCLIKTATKELISGCKESIIPTNGSVISIAWAAFLDCKTLEQIVIPESVASFDAESFSGCSGLEQIVIPISVTSTGSHIFYGCSKLTIYVRATSKPELWADAWNISNCTVFWGYIG